MSNLSERRLDEVFVKPKKLTKKELEWCKQRLDEIVRDFKKRLSEKKENEKL